MEDKYIYYEYDGRNLKVPVERQREFESRIPDAKMMLTYDGKNYKVPLSDVGRVLAKVGANNITYSAFDDKKEYSPSMSTRPFFDEYPAKGDVSAEDFAPAVEPIEPPMPSVGADMTAAMPTDEMTRRERRKARREERGPNWFETIGKSVGATATNLARNLVVDPLNELARGGAEVPNALGPGTGLAATIEAFTGKSVLDDDNPLENASRKMAETSSRLSQEADPSKGEGYGALFKKFRIDKVAQKALGDVIQSIPIQIAMRNPAALAIYGTGMLSSELADQRRENPDIPEWKRTAMAIGSVGLEIAVEKLADPLKSLFAKGSGNITQEMADDILQTAAREGSESIAKRIAKVLGKVGKDAVGEGGEELITSFGTDALGEALDAMDGDKDYGIRAQWENAREENPDITIEEFAMSKGKEYMEAFLGGALSSPYMSATAIGTQHVRNNKARKALDESRLRGSSMDYRDLYDVDDAVREDVNNAVNAFTDRDGNTSVSQEYIENLSANGALTIAMSENAEISSEQRTALYTLAMDKAQQEGLNKKFDDNVYGQIIAQEILVDATEENGQVTTGIYNGNAVYVMGGVANNGSVTLSNGENGPVMVIDAATGEQQSVRSEDIVSGETLNAEDYKNSLATGFMQNEARNRETARNTMSPRAKLKAIQPYAGKKIVVDVGNGLTEVLVQDISSNGTVIIKGKKGDLGGRSMLTLNADAFYDAIYRDDDGNPVVTDAPQEENTSAEQAPDSTGEAVATGDEDFRGGSYDILINGVPVSVDVVSQDNTSDSIVYEYVGEDGRVRSGSSTINGFKTAIAQAANYTSAEPAPTAEPQPSDIGLQVPQEVPVTPDTIDWDSLFEKDPDAYFAEMQKQFGEETLDILNEEIAAAQEELDSLSKKRGKTTNERLENRQKKVALQGRIDTLNGMIARLAPAAETIAETPVVPETTDAPVTETPATEPTATEAPAEVSPTEQPTIPSEPAPVETTPVAETPAVPESTEPAPVEQTPVAETPAETVAEPEPTAQPTSETTPAPEAAPTPAPVPMPSKPTAKGGAIARMIAESKKQIAKLAAKANIKDFTVDDNARPVFGGVLRQGGYEYASDSHILAKIKTKYPAEQEGKIYSVKTGKEIKGRFPKADLVISGAESINTPIDANVDDILAAAQAAEELKKGIDKSKKIYVKVGRNHFDSSYLLKAARMAKQQGLTTITQHPTEKRAMLFSGENGVALIMPMTLGENPDVIDASTGEAMFASTGVAHGIKMPTTLKGIETARSTFEAVLPNLSQKEIDSLKDSEYIKLVDDKVVVSFWKSDIDNAKKKAKDPNTFAALEAIEKNGLEIPLSASEVAKLFPESVAPTAPITTESTPTAPKKVSNPIDEARKKERQLALNLTKVGLSPEAKQDLAFNAGKAIADMFATREEYDAYAENATDFGSYNFDFERGVEESFANLQRNVSNSPVNSVPLENEPNGENNGEAATEESGTGQSDSGSVRQTSDGGGQEANQGASEAEPSQGKNKSGSKTKQVASKYPVRKGNATQKLLKDTFGFESVTIPNSRKDTLNAIYDFMMEMSKMLGISPKSIGQGGTLGVGSLNARARATAEHSLRRNKFSLDFINASINFKYAKLEGIAHEWWHALDYALGYFDSSKVYGTTTEMSDRQFSGRKETYDAVQAVMQAIKDSGYPARIRSLTNSRASLKYYLDPTEMAARAFDGYLRDLFAAAGISIEGASYDYIDIDPSQQTPEEMAVIAPALANLFKVLQEKEGKTPGTSVLYHIGEMMAEDSPAKRLATDAVLTALDDYGIDVVRATDEQTQQMLDVMEEVAEMQKGKAPETASVQEEHHPTVVSSADGAKVIKDLDSAIQEYDEKSGASKTILGDIAKALGAKITGRTEFYLTPNGTVYGWTDGKKIYLTKAGINPNTPIHEYTHLWAKAMIQKNPKGWNSIKQLLKGTPVWNEVMNDPNYSNIHNDEDAVASEALSRISGSENAAKMEQMAQKMIDEAKGTARKLEARGLIQNMRDALSKFWNWVGTNLFGIEKFKSVEQITDRVLYDLLNNTNLGELSEGQVETQIVTDPKVIAELEASPKQTGYRNVVQNEDGTFSSPMAFWLQSTKGGAKTRIETAKFEIGKWEEAEEHPELVDDKGKVTLVKPNKSTVANVAYDPYIHNRLEPVNLQFKDAWKRNDLVYVQTEVAENDLNDGYHADKALLPVGVHSWSNGAVMLSRYDKPVRIMPWEDVADAWATRLNGEGVEFDVVPPALRSLLLERGVEILPPHKGMGKDCNDAYKEWKNGEPKNKSLHLQINELDYVQDNNIQRGVSDGDRESASSKGRHRRTDANDRKFHGIAEGYTGDTLRRAETTIARIRESLEKHRAEAQRFIAIYPEATTQINEFFDNLFYRNLGVVSLNADEFIADIKSFYGNSAQDLVDFIESIKNEQIDIREEEVNNALREIGIAQNEIVSYDTLKDIFYSFAPKQYESVLFDRLIDLAKRLDVKVMFTTSQKNSPIKVDGLYDAGQNFVAMDASLLTGLGVNNDIDLTNRIVHELLHSVTSKGFVLKQNYDLFIKSGQKALAQAIQLPPNIYDALETLESVYEVIKKDSAVTGSYGVENKKEMIAELSNPEFRKKLSDKGLWERVKGAIVKLLSYIKGESQTNTLSVIEDAVDKLLSELQTGSADHLYSLFIKSNSINGNQISFAKSHTIQKMDADYLAAVERGDMETAQRMVNEAAKRAMPNTKVVDENGNPKVVYHGSNAQFTEFDTARIGSTTGTADGRGFYFTTDKDYAEGFTTPEGQLFDVFLNIDSPLSYDRKTITKAQLRKILKEADRVEFEREGEHYMLSNYANYNDVGIDGAINEAANLEYDYADNDVELVGSLIGGSGSFELIMDAVRKVTGKSGMIAPKDNGTTHYVVTNPSAIKSASAVTYDDAGNVIPLSQRFNPLNPDIRYRGSENNSLSSQSYEGTGEYNTASDGRGEGVQEELPVLRPALLLGAGSVDREVSQADFIRFNPISKREGESDGQRNNRENKFLSFINGLTSEEQVNLYVFLKDYISSPSGILRGRATDFINSIRQKGNNSFADFVEDFINDELKYREGVSSAAVAKHGLLVGIDQNLSAIERMFYAFNNDDYNRVLFDRVLKLAKRFGVTVKFATRNADGSFISEYGSYNPNDNSITLDANLLVKGNEAELCQTILHELIHSVVARGASIMTGRAVDKNNQFIDPQSLPKDVVDGINTLKEVYEAIKDDGTFQDTYGKKDFEEMLSEITDPKFRGLLKAKKLWKKFLNGICKILGIADESSSETDALTEIESALDKILSAAERGELDSAYASYLGRLAEGYTLEDLQRLGDGPVKTMLAQNILFRTGIDPDTASRETAKAVYDRVVTSMWQETQRQFQDAMQPVRVAIDAIQQETGNTPIEDYENYLLIQNQTSSRSRNQIETFKGRYYDPIVEQVNLIIDELMDSRGLNVKDEKRRSQVYKEVIKYLIAKHGLERNKYYQTHKTRRLTFWEMKPELDQAEQDYNYKVNQINADTSLTDAERQLQLRDAKDEYDAVVQEIKTREIPDIRDYSGLTTLFATDDFQEAERQAQEYVDNLEALVDTTQLWDKINAATDKTLRHSYESGLISRQQYNDIKSMFNFYIPLRGFDETTAEDVYAYARFEGNRFNPAVAKTKGRKSLADDPIAMIMNMAESEIAQGNKNRAKQALYNFLLNRTITDGRGNQRQNSLMQIQDVWYVKSVDASGNVTYQIAAPNHAAGETYEDFENRMLTLEAAGNAMKSKKGQVDVGMRFQKVQNQNAHYVYLKVNGVEKAIYINGNPKAAEAINGTDKPKPSEAGEAMRAVNRFISSTFTNYSLEFTARNYFRDMLYSHINVAVNESDPAYRKTFRKNWRKNNMRTTLKLLKAYRAGELEGRVLTDVEAAFVQFMENGGQTGYTLINSVETHKKDLERAIERMRKGIEKGGIKDSTVFKYTLGGIELLNETSELVTRFAAFKTSRDMGRSVVKSISDAKEVTVNFNTKGAQDGKGALGIIARYLGGAKFFFNASVQGVQNVAAMARANKLKFGTVVGGFAAFGFMMPLIQGALISLLGGDDEDEYWNIPEYDRQNNICIVLGNGKYAKMPLPIGFREVYAIGDMLAAMAFDKKFSRDVMQVGMDMANKISSIILPVNPLEGAANGLAFWQSFLNTVSPSSAQFAIQNAYNTDWKGAPLQKEYSWNIHDPQWMKAFASNPDWMTGLSKWCNENIDINDDMKGMDWSPERLDNTLSNLGGGIYSLIKKTGRSISMIWNEEERNLSNVPLAGVVFGSGIDSDDRFVTDAYYEMKDYYEDRINRIETRAKSFGYTLEDVFSKKIGAHHPKMQEVYGNKEFDFMQKWYMGNKELEKAHNAVKKIEREINRTKEPSIGMQEELVKKNAEFEDKRRKLVNELLELE